MGRNCNCSIIFGTSINLLEEICVLGRDPAGGSGGKIDRNFVPTCGLIKKRVCFSGINPAYFFGSSGGGLADTQEAGRGFFDLDVGFFKGGHFGRGRSGRLGSRLGELAGELNIDVEFVAQNGLGGHGI